MYFGLNMDDEQDGKGSEYVRPVLIIKKFNKNLFWGCAISSKLKSNNLYDLQRLRNKMDVCTLGDFCKIKQAIKDML
jgi:mRNA interferase MazF